MDKEVKGLKARPAKNGVGSCVAELPIKKL